MLNRPEYLVASAAEMDFQIWCRSKAQRRSELSRGRKISLFAGRIGKAAVYVPSKVCKPEMVAARGESDLILKARDEAGLSYVMRMCWHCEPDQAEAETPDWR